MSGLKYFQIALVMLLVSTLVSAEEKSDEQRNLSKLTQSLMEQAHIPGVSIAYIKDGKRVWSNSFGVTNTNTNKQVTPETRFEAASLSKPVLAYMVMKFVERGELTLDTPLHTILSYPRISHSEYAKQLTPRLILSHQSGLPNWGGDPLTFEHPPATQFNYSGEGYVYLQNVLETLSGMDFQALAEREVFKPLGMEHSAFTWSETNNFPVASGHTITGEPVSRNVPKANAASSLHTTAIDYARFIEVWLEQPTWLVDALSPAVWLTGKERGSDTPVAENTLGWALGFGVEIQPTQTVFWHWGDNGVFRGFVAMAPDSKTALVYFANSQNGLAIARQLTEAVFGDLKTTFAWLQYGQSNEPGWQHLHAGHVAETKGDYDQAISHFNEVVKLFPDNDRLRKRIEWLSQLTTPQSTSVMLTETQLNRYPGNYGPRIIKRQGSSLVYQRAGGKPHLLTPISDSVFRVGDVFNFRLEVVTDEAGQPIKLVGHYIDGYTDQSPRSD